MLFKKTCLRVTTQGATRLSAAHYELISDSKLAVAAAIAVDAPGAVASVVHSGAVSVVAYRLSQPFASSLLLFITNKALPNPSLANNALFITADNVLAWSFISTRASCRRLIPPPLPPPCPAVSLWANRLLPFLRCDPFFAFASAWRAKACRRCCCCCFLSFFSSRARSSSRRRQETTCWSCCC